MAKQSTRIELENYLNGLNLPYKPVIHVNGKDFPTAVVTVDFGYTAPPVRLSTEQSQELVSKIRKLVRDLVTREGLNIRVSSDSYLGLVYYASI